MDHTEKHARMGATQGLLGARERLAILKNVYGIKACNVWHAQVELNGKVEYVFRNKRYFAEQVFNPKRRYPPLTGKFKAAIILWLQQTYDRAISPEVLDFECDTAEQFHRHYRNSRESASRPVKISQFGDALLDEMGWVIAQAEVLPGQEAYRTTDDSPSVGERTATELARRMARTDKPLPAPLLDRVASVVDLCGGCGKGAEIFAAYKPVLETAWARGVADLSRLNDDAELLGLANVGSKAALGAMVEGRHDDAQAIGAAAASLLTRVPVNPASLKIATRLYEPIRRTGQEHAGRLGEIERAFGPDSREYVSELKCRACRAIACGSRDAQQAISAAEAATHKALRRNPREAERLSWDLRDIEFLKIVHLRRDARRSMQELDRKGLDALRELWMHTKSPVRRAYVALHILPLAKRQHEELRHLSIRDLDERPFVKSICIIDVANLRAELESWGRPTPA